MTNPTAAIAAIAGEISPYNRPQPSPSACMTVPGRMGRRMPLTNRSSSPNSSRPPTMATTRPPMVRPTARLLCRRQRYADRRAEDEAQQETDEYNAEQDDAEHGFVPFCNCGVCLREPLRPAGKRTGNRWMSRWLSKWLPIHLDSHLDTDLASPKRFLILTIRAGWFLIRPKRYVRRTTHPSGRSRTQL
jgi:hypothetical protein